MNIRTCLCAAALSLAAGSASALVAPNTFGFSDFETGGDGASIADQFMVTATSGSTGVFFDISNDADTTFSPRGRIVGIEDTMNLLAANVFIGGTGVSFRTGGNVPQANDDGLYDDFVFSATQGNARATIADGNVLRLGFSLTAGSSFDDVIAALTSGSLGFGVHVTSIGDNDGSSDTIATQPMGAVPLPAGLPLLVAGLGAFGFLRSRRKAA